MGQKEPYIVISKVAKKESSVAQKLLEITPCGIRRWVNQGWPVSLAGSGQLDDQVEDISGFGRHLPQGYSCSKPGNPISMAG